MKKILLTLFLLNLTVSSFCQSKTVELYVDSAIVYFRYFYTSKNNSDITLSDSVRLVSRRISDDMFFLDKVLNKKTVWTGIYKIQLAKDSLSVIERATDHRGTRTIRLKIPYYTGIIVDDFTDVSDDNMRQIVLNIAIPDSTFIFGSWSEKGGTETRLTFLGSATTKDGRVLKVMNYEWVWGLSSRVTARLLIFDGKNQYLGNYQMSQELLPSKMRDGVIEFANVTGECDGSLMTSVDLRKGLPRKIFRLCKHQFGDMLIFSNE